MADPTDAPPKPSRHLTFAEGSSHKFWKIELDGSSHTVTFGKIGTAGQSQTKDFDGPAEARKSFDKLVAEKTKKGYVDAGAAPQPASASASAPASAPAASTSPAAAPAGPKKAAKPKAKAKAAEPEAPVEAEPEPEPGPEAEAPVEPKADRAVDGEVDLAARREIRLDPEDWARASFRDRPVVELPRPRPFDGKACLEQLPKLKRSSYMSEVRWDDLKLPISVTPEEAHFWLVAMTAPVRGDVDVPALARAFERGAFDGKVSADDALGLVGQSARLHIDPISRALANLLGPIDHMELILNRDAQGQQSLWHGMALMIEGFRKYALPRLSAEDRQSLRDRIARGWDPTKQAATYSSFPAEYYLAAALGMADHVAEVTSLLSSDRYRANEWADRYEHPQDLVFGLGSADAVAEEWRRLGLKFRSADHVRAFLACTEYAALGEVAEGIVEVADKETCEALSKALALVEAPEAAGPMLRCKSSARAPAVARDWLDRHVGLAVAGLIGVAEGRGNLADAAIEHLRDVKRRGMAGLIAEALDASNRGGSSRVRAEVLDREEKVFEPFDAATTPGWLADAIGGAAPGKRLSLPAWASAVALPPLVVGDRRLGDDQVDALLQRLARLGLGDDDPLFAAIREHVPRSTRDEFAWKVFQCWQEGGFVPKEKWAMAAIARVGADGCVLKLVPKIRAWPGESQHARAVLGLECLRAIGSSVALMQLAGIAQKLKFKGLKAKAEEFVEQIARERGLTRDELEDRVVPDCGLDDDGRRTFSFGPRSFSFALGGDLKPMVRDEAGKLRPNLPEPNAKDDAERARASVDDWKLMKKQIKEVATIQAGRLEQALVTGRRWAADDFEALLVRHPLMTHLAQKLVWAGFDASGARVVTFRVTEERDYADLDDDPAGLDAAAAVGIVHPLLLDDAERGRWGEVLGDYEVVPPFPQLGRTVYGLEPGEASSKAIERFRGVKLPAPSLVFTLEKLGWTRGVAMDAGCFDEHSKQFPAANVTAVVGYDGTVGMGYIDPSEDLSIESVCFCEGLRAPSGYGWDLSKAVELGRVPPVVVSEVLADLHVLKGKAK